jgi:hypothetical protein
MSLQDTITASNGTLQDDMSRAMAAYTGAELGVAIRSAERAHRGRIFEATRAATGITATGEMNEIIRDPQRNENVAATDATPFTLVGGRYIVSATATWNDTGTVTLQDAAGETFATFTDDGSATVNLRYATYSLAIDTAIDVSVTISRGSYTDGVASI